MNKRVTGISSSWVGGAGGWDGARSGYYLSLSLPQVARKTAASGGGTTRERMP